MTPDPSTEALRETIQHALDRLLAQDPWEQPAFAAAGKALDALAARLSQAEEALDLALDELRTVRDFVRGSNASYVFSRVEEAWLAASSAGESE